MLTDCIALPLTVESAYTVDTGMKVMDALDIPNADEPTIHFLNERNQNRKLAKISRDAHAHRQNAILGSRCLEALRESCFP